MNFIRVYDFICVVVGSYENITVYEIRTSIGNVWKYYIILWQNYRYHDYDLN